MKANAARAGSGKAGLALAALLLLLGLPTLLFPYGRDQAMFAYVGQVWRQGGLPYRDAWDVKLPAIYAVYALVGGVSWGPRLLDLLAVVAGMMALVWLARQGPSPPGPLSQAAGEGEFEPPLPNPSPEGKGLSVGIQDGGGFDGACTGPVVGSDGVSCPTAAGTRDGGGVGGNGVVGLVAAALLFVFTFGALDYWNLAQAETLIGPLVAVALAAGLGGHALLAGLLVGAAACFKTTAVLFVLPVGCAVWSGGFQASRRPGVRAFRHSGIQAFGVGAVVMPAAFVAYFAARGGLPYLVELVRVQSEYAGGDPRTAGLSPLELVRVLGLGAYLPLVVASAAALVPWLRDRHLDRSVRWAVALWWGVALVQIVVQRRFYLYHWSVLTPAAGFLAADGFWRLWWWRVGWGGWRVGPEPPFPATRARVPDSPKGKGLSAGTRANVRVPRGVAVGLLVLGVAGPAVRGLRRIPEAVGVATGRVGLEAYHRRFSGVFDYSVADGMDAARHVTSRSGTGDRMLVLGFEPHLYLYAGRTAPSRHASDAPLFGEKSIRESRRQAWLAELLADLEREPPLYYVEWEPPAVIARPEWAQMLNRFRFRYYREEGKYGRFRVFRRRAGARPFVDTPTRRG